ncbi:hypothetical protein [uncultured Jatrophihabitans sp.]|uniref:hypothetical protein n=1 Tax=uncultured Jatrophihabitans sp. TaxID=1610747 RepID=UPI0035CAC102
MADHTGVTFRDGPSGRRAALAFGPDVWEVVKVLREIEARGDAAIAATTEVLALPETKIRVAMHYYSAYPEEIDAEIQEADRLSNDAEQAWRVERRLLAWASRCCSTRCTPRLSPPPCASVATTSLRSQTRTNSAVSPTSDCSDGR